MMQLSKQYAILLPLIFLLSSCGENGSATTPPIPDAVDPGRLIPANYTGGDVPQLDLSAPDANWTWNDPHVLQVGASNYWMYASATDSFVFPVRLYRLTSDDGQTWTRNPEEPILADAPDGAWDAGGMETPTVVFFQGSYHLFYTGYQYPVGSPDYIANSPGDFRIGHAVSTDGIHFTRSGDIPIVAPSGTADADPGNDWYAFLIGEPGAVVFNNELYVYFTAVGADTGVMASLQVIGVIRTADGETWSAPELALKPDQELYPRNEDWVGYSTPSAIVISGSMHLFFDVAHQPEGGSWLQLRLHHAISSDGIRNWTQDDSPIRTNTSYAWTANEIRSPAPLLDGTVLKLYFAGHELNGESPEHFGIGMLECDLAQ